MWQMLGCVVAFVLGGVVASIVLALLLMARDEQSRPHRR